jgi:3-methylcrotonyl-CoA carboxylase alpha subunit
MKAGLIQSQIRKILVANRGEIALRIFRAARVLNIAVVFIYAEEEASSSWISQSAESYSLGEGNVSQTYLNIPKILDVARRSGADAIHPGYGFLSENHGFAEACENNGITFIGPSPAILKLMGDKIAAHALVSSLGIKGPETIVKKPDEILFLKDSIEYPVLVKAAAGGGGKGMRLVRHPQDLSGVLETTANEAMNFFADNRIYLEKYLESPRHIEVQILGDRQGNIVHLYERECSIQRRHQKLIEEAPAVILSGDMRAQITGAALKIARAIGYYSAGTIEFLLDKKGDFYFLEMNPRIQVEHGITEMITGLDIVVEQIRIAAGHPLSFNGIDIAVNGFAMEARIYAEDPLNNLMPSAGKIDFYQGTAGEGIRMESSIHSGDVISSNYDPLLAKVMVHASSRQQAIAKLKRALDSLVITGVRHNTSLLNTVLLDGEFQRNEVSTTFLDEKIDGFTQQILAKSQETNSLEQAIAAACIVLFTGNTGLPPGAPVWKQIGLWRIIPLIRFKIGSEYLKFEYFKTGRYSVDIMHGGTTHVVQQIITDENQVSFQLSNKTSRFYYHSGGEGALELTDGTSFFTVERCDLTAGSVHEDYKDQSPLQEGFVLSPLSGRVTGIHVSRHDRIKSGDDLITIESMKLENKILAQHPGIVKHIKVNEGDQVHKDTLLMLLTSDKN